jgi:uncharacterized protein YgbK (DUF1537 family)
MKESPVNCATLLASLPPEWPEDLLPVIVRENSAGSVKVVVLDDDPTGTQTVRDIPVLTTWSEPALRRELQGEYPGFFLLTNSRSLTGGAAADLAREIGSNLRAAAAVVGVSPVVISRSDSTLRGHFPGEVDALAASLGQEDAPRLLIPFFLEGGRFTIDNVHYVQDGDRLIPAAQTPFAGDAVFGFHSSEMRQWVEEKTAGRVRAEEVKVISLSDLRRGGPKRVAALLGELPSRAICVVNAASYRDLQVLVAALLPLEKAGRRFVYRTAASFVRTRLGQGHRFPLLPPDKLTVGTPNGGLFIVGSYVAKTGRQLENLCCLPGIEAIEIGVENLLANGDRPGEIDSAARRLNGALRQGRDCVLYTSRRLVTGEDAAANLAIGGLVSDSLVTIVRSLTAQPRYLVAKGGITSSDIATRGLGVLRALVLGQALPGVPVWQLGPETRYSGMPYIVFPGNVGADDALAELRNMLCRVNQPLS